MHLVTDSNSKSELETENDVVEAPWLKTDAETNRHWINITDLEDGFNYEFRVVSVSGGKKESRSPVVVQLVGAGTLGKFILQLFV